MPVLQHQGITFKANDKRYISSKSLVSEIETLRRTEMQKQIALPPRLRPPSQTYQLAFPISDENVLFDSLKLFLSYLDRAPGYHTMAERDRIEAFLRSLTSLVFAIPVSVLDAMLTPVQDDSRSGLMSDDGDGDGLSDSASSSVDQPIGGTKKVQGVLLQNAAAAAKKEADLRKKVLKVAGAGGKRLPRTDSEATPMSSRESTPFTSTQPLVDSSSGLGLSPAYSAVGDREHAFMDGAHSSTDGARNTLEMLPHGDISFKKEVPTSAAGLDGMQGVETIQTHMAEVQNLPAVEVPQPASEIEPANSTVQFLTKVVESGPSATATKMAAPATDEGSMQTSPPEVAPLSQPNGTSTPILQPAQPYGQPQIRRFNFFCNTPYYCAIRLLHVSRDLLHSVVMFLTYTVSSAAVVFPLASYEDSCSCSQLNDCRRRLDKHILYSFWKSKSSLYWSRSDCRGSHL